MLRFAAAMMVAVMHITQAISVHITGLGNAHYWGLGSAGVDIFFVISGFVMGMTTPPSAAHLAERARQAWHFFKRRLIRVVPLYWFYTLLKVVLLAALPALATRFALEPAHLGASLLFLPWTSPWGTVEPVLPVGWTLNFEMLFYAVFALALLLGLSRLALTLGVFLLLMAAAPLCASCTALQFFGRSIALEFVAGVALARLYQRGAPLAPEAGLLALSLGLVLLLAVPWSADDDRFLSWGLAALLIVAGAVWLEPWTARLQTRAASLVFLGNASYSIYLSHTFVVPAAVRASAEVGLQNVGAVGLLVALAVVLAGCLSYAVLERPVTQGLQRWLLRPPGSATSPLTAQDASAQRPSRHAS
jgi:exopolysaccharide production protein ExoZ